MRLIEAPTQREIVLTSTSTEVVVTELRPYTLYQCSVAAVTVAEGPFSADLVAITAEDGKYTCVQMYKIIKAKF